ncbi:class II histone deacetylase [Cryptosporangium arvum]|uniref:Deacetylase, histone deacetylase/acetoin utilization protein n=1 Tax=Cryptosporangium arvum DSM 44712 TaxID=927661 RepID=A0A010Z2D0_9ACTN|nr:class II histone deacetylase [Cryptosporangium arvum]EXG81583.1 deacetylase, histone deacetylase/acetoin utilization protein [Cryptosporangium arvum DSM 44712]
MATGWVWSERYMWHDAGTAGGPLPVSRWVEPMTHIEGPDAKRRFANLVAASGLLERLTVLAPRPATVAELTRVHRRSYVDEIARQAAAGGGNLGGGTPFGEFSYEIALLAAGGTITAVEAVVGGTVENAYALVRPPGHHATPEHGRGFCLFNNIAVAARHAQATLGVGRIAIVDWDVHHGNGTQDTFWDDPSVLAVSIHQDGVYPPRSGPVTDTGAHGTIVNVPLPAGSGDGAYRAAFADVVEPALDRFAPDLILVACGFDANGFDPLARQMLSSESFRWMTGRVKAAAERHCEGRLVLTHEGGYSPFAVPFCGLAVVEELSGVRTEVEDPFLPIVENYGGRLLPHQAEAIARAQRNDTSWASSS